MAVCVSLLRRALGLGAPGVRREGHCPCTPRYVSRGTRLLAHGGRGRGRGPRPGRSVSSARRRSAWWAFREQANRREPFRRVRTDSSGGPDGLPGRRSWPTRCVIHGFEIDDAARLVAGRGTRWPRPGCWIHESFYTASSWQFGSLPGCPARHIRRFRARRTGRTTGRTPSAVTAGSRVRTDRRSDSRTRGSH